jgi:hypothetical protein
LCSSGLHWNTRVKGRAAKTDKALDFVCMIFNAILKAGKGGIENPVGCISTRIYYEPLIERYIVLPKPEPKIAVKATQIIQPYEYGHDASKKTCLFLHNLPKLKGTTYVQPRLVNGRPRWGNQTDSGQNRLGPSEDRGDIRSITYTGIAEAMAKQWSPLIKTRL